MCGLEPGACTKNLVLGDSSLFNDLGENRPWVKLGENLVPNDAPLFTVLGENLAPRDENGRKEEKHK